MNIILRISIVVVLIAKMFHIVHWPFKSIVGPLENIAMGAIMLTYFFRFYSKSPKVTLDFVKLLLVVSWVLSYSLSLFNYSGATLSFGLTFVLFAYWFTTEGFSRIMGRKHVKGDSNKVAVFFIPALFIAVVGAMFKIMHWPGGTLLLVIGISYSAIGVLVAIFRKSKEEEPYKKVSVGRKLAVGLIILIGGLTAFITGGRFVSNNLLSEFVLIESSIDARTFERSKEVDNRYDLLKKYPVLTAEVDEIRTTANEAIDLIETNKLDITKQSHGDMSDSYVSASYYLVANGGQHEQNLLLSINQFKDAVKPYYNDSLRHQILDTQMSTKEQLVDQGVMLTWGQHLCEHLPVAAVITNLSLWQSYIRNAEIVALNEILKERKPVH